MNYNHHFHAGNFADVFKHLILIFCLEKISKKDAPFFVLDTHSGKAKYDLQDSPSTRTGEALDGIVKFLKNQNLQNKNLENYLKILAKINNCELDFLKNNSDKIKLYPGSPYIIRFFLHQNGRAIFNELRKDEFLLLKKNLAGSKQISFSHNDGFELVKSKLPPIEKRGIILIDPAFEKNSDLISKDYEKIITTLKEAKKRFSHGVYLIWHPIINKENEQKTLENFYQNIKNLQFQDIVHIIFKNDNTDSKMSACGMFVINSSFELKEKLFDIFKDKIEVKDV